MTRRFLKDRTVNEYPVEFVLYKLAHKDIIVVDDEGKPRTIAKAGQPNPHSMTSVVLTRLIDKGETVGDTIKRFKKMIEGSNLRYQVKWAPETDAEFKERLEKEGKEIVTNESIPITEVSGEVKAKRINKAKAEERKAA